VDFGRAPGRILSGHPADEFLDFGGDSSSTRGWSARPPAPIQPKSCAMPTHHRLRLHDQEHLGQRDQTLRNAVQNNRSIRLSLGRGRLRFRTATCWRKARISRARSVRHVKKTLAAVAKSRMNRSMNLPLYHGQVSDSGARQSFGDEQPRTPACDRSHRSAIEAYRYVSDSDLDVEHRQRTNPGRTDASPTSAASADSDAINSPPV
jgi:hypothetical protein